MKRTLITLIFLQFFVFSCSSQSTEEEKKSDPPPSTKTATQLPKADTKSPAQEIPIQHAEETEEQKYARLNKQIEQEIAEQVEVVRKKERPNVYDYYLALPHAWVFADCNEEGYGTMEDRKSSLIYQNLKGGFLRSKELEGNQVIVLFRNKLAQKDYICIKREHTCGADFPCGPTYHGFARLDASGNWVKAHKELSGGDKVVEMLLDRMVWGTHELILPEKGTSILIEKCMHTDIPGGKDLGKLVWKQSHFEAELTQDGEAYVLGRGWK